MGLIFLLNSSLGLLQKSPIDDYGIFYKGGLGYSESYGQAVRCSLLENELKKYLPQKNLRKTSGCERSALYLKKYSISATEEKPINIDKHTSEGIVLVNARLDKMDEIKKGIKKLQENADVWFENCVTSSSKKTINSCTEMVGRLYERSRKIRPDLVKSIL